MLYPLHRDAIRSVGRRRFIIHRPVLEALEHRELLACSHWCLDSSFTYPLVDATQGHIFIPNFKATANALAAQSDDKIVMAGTIPDQINPNLALVRLEKDGRPDKSFGVNGIVTQSFYPFSHPDTVFAVAVQPAAVSGTGQEMIVAAGIATPCRSEGDRPSRSVFALTRYYTRIDSDGHQPGALDMRFGAGGAYADPLSGNCNNPGPSLPGRVAITFQQLPDKENAFMRAGGANTLMVQPDGRIIVAGWADFGEPVDPPGYPQYNQLAVARLMPDGTPDRSFGNIPGKGEKLIDVGQDDEIEEIKDIGLISIGNGKHDIIISGLTKTPSGGADFLIARLNSDTGAPQWTRIIDFSKGGIAHHDVAWGVLVQADGTIVAVGESTGGLGGSQFAIAWLTPGGKLDPRFDADGLKLFGVDLANVARDAVLVHQAGAAGPQVAVGGFSQPNAGPTYFSGALLSVDGATVEATFRSEFSDNFDADDRASGLIVHDGRIVAGGFHKLDDDNFGFAAIRLCPDPKQSCGSLALDGSQALSSRAPASTSATTLATSIATVLDIHLPTKVRPSAVVLLVPCMKVIVDPSTMQSVLPLAVTLTRLHPQRLTTDVTSSFQWLWDVLS